MSTAHRVLFCDELLFQICLHATALTLWNLHMTTKGFRSVALRVTASMIRDDVRPFVGDVHKFFRILEDQSSVIGGDLALGMAVVNQSVRPLSTSILSVFVPSGGADYMRGIFMGWGYGRVPLVGHKGPDKQLYMTSESYRDCSNLPRGSQSYTRLVRLSGPAAWRVDIIESNCSHAAYPILFGQNTASYNLISPTHLCVTYPQPTNRLCFRSISWAASAVLAGSILEMRGFERGSSQEEDERRLFDEGCMILPFGAVETEPDRRYWATIGVLRSFSFVTG